MRDWHKGNLLQLLDIYSLVQFEINNSKVCSALMCRLYDQYHFFTFLPRLFETATQADVRITSVEIQEPNLEAVFLHLTGRALRD